MNLKPLAGLLALATTLCFADGAGFVMPPPPPPLLSASSPAAGATATTAAAVVSPAASGSTHEVIRQTTTARGVTTASSSPSGLGEPGVTHTVIEDDSTRIDELRVRGQLQRIVVTSKATGTSYEIITGDGSRELFDSATNTRGAAGQRVWNVLRF